EVTRELIDSFREANQAIAKSIVAAEERNMQFAHSTFTNSMEVLKVHAEATRGLMRELEQQMQKQQAAFQQMTQGTADRELAESYTAFFRAPLAFYQQAFDTAETAARQGLETMQKTAQQAPHATHKATR